MAHAAPGGAQERSPAPIDIALSPGGELVAIRARDSGIVVRAADGSLRLWCAAALGTVSRATLWLQAVSSDRLLVGSFSGLSSANTTTCERTPPEGGFAQAAILGLQAQRAGSGTLHAIANEEGVTTIIASDDDGRTWRAVGTLPEGSSYLNGVIAPSDPSRAYLSGVRSEADAGVVELFVAVSRDGGESVAHHPLPSDDPERELELLAVDRDDPDRLVAAMKFPDHAAHAGHESRHETDADTVYVSEDAARSFRELLTVRVLGGFASTGDGSTLWIADARGGLYRSTDSGATFEEIAEFGVSCLEHDGERLWACTDVAETGFSVGVSQDGGESFEARASFGDVYGSTCDALARRGCAAPWMSWQFWFDTAGAPQDAGAAPLDAGGRSMLDASREGREPGASNGEDDPGDNDGGVEARSNAGGCGCRIAPRSSAFARTASNAVAALLVLLLIARRFWRRDSPTAALGLRCSRWAGSRDRCRSRR